MLSHQESKRFYDWFGSKQDWQRFYEDPAVSNMLTHAAFESAEAVFEFGCGTGRLARRLLEELLPPSATYQGIDVSETMVSLAQRALAPFGERAQVQLSSGEVYLEIDDASMDRFLSTYVLDLLSEEDILALLEEASRILVPGGLLCLTGLTKGATPLAAVIERAWVGLHHVRPQWLGGCRPISLPRFLEDRELSIEHHTQITSLALTSEVVIARKVEFP